MGDQMKHIYIYIYHMGMSSQFEMIASVHVVVIRVHHMVYYCGAGGIYGYYGQQG